MKHSRQPSNSVRAFTLLELTLAMVAGAVILTAIYGLLSRAIHLRDNATTRVREARVRAHALAVLRNDLRNGLVSGKKLAATLSGSASGRNSSFPGYLAFTTTTAQDIVEDAQEVPSSDVQRVEYYLVTDPDAEDRKSGLLVRTVERDLLATVQTTPSEESLLPGIESMEVSFYDGSTWQESWDYEESKTAPEAVRVRLQPSAVDRGAPPAPLEVLVPWPAKMVVEATATTGAGQ